MVWTFGLTKMRIIVITKDQPVILLVVVGIFIAIYPSFYINKLSKMKFGTIWESQNTFNKTYEFGSVVVYDFIRNDGRTLGDYPLDIMKIIG